jgi:YesN/AraC family two-component response regulator
LLLTKVLPAMELTDSSANQDSVKNVLIYCMENYLEPLTLEKMARDLHLNKFYLSHIFNERIKLGFSDFLNNLRVEHACKILGREETVIEVAYASGFSSIRTFNRVFRERTGLTPRAYLKKKLEEQDKGKRK